jgi:asparagine synthase (glutamine-hydrolysing)
MTRTLHHRGPDHAGQWVDADAGIALGHQRLAVLDLSAAGHQPMLSACGRYVMVFNGEIYNHLGIRSELQQASTVRAWRGHSDTETVLAAIETWGIEATLSRLAGMFAFALWDRHERILTLVRDRMGEKPLYYGWQGPVFLFGSELKALRAHPDFRAPVDRDVLAQYLLHGYIRAPATIHAGVFQLSPGTFLRLTARDTPGTLPPAAAYWSLGEVVERGRARPFAGSEQDAVLELESELSRCIAQQRVADVPVGAFLSGGMDSSLVVALMQAQASGPVRTFTIGFREPQYNEADFAAQVARHLGTDHTEAYVTPAEAMAVIPTLPRIYDEPFGDSSAIATILVSRIARREVTASLSGDGGDELFAGYSRYRRTSEAWSLLRRVPYPLRSVASLGLRALYQHRGGSLTAWKASRLALYLAARTAADCYAANVSQGGGSEQLVIGGHATRGARAPQLTAGDEDSYSSMMYADCLTYLPDDILVKVDRAAMSASLESRVPMLDHRLVEFAWRLPFSLKVRAGQGKWLLRQLLRKYLPDSLLQRPKMGFGVPVGEWIRGPLREWAEELLDEPRLRADGFLHAPLVRAKWRRYLQGASLEGDGIWHLLMFQAWLAHAQSGAGARAWSAPQRVA